MAGKTKTKAKTRLVKAAGAEHQATGKAARNANHPAIALPGAASEIADQPPLVAIGVATLMAGALLRQPTLARSGARMLAAHALATGLKTLVKRSVDRTRPSHALAKGHDVKKGKDASRGALNSFPSGHTAGAVAVAQAIAHSSPAAAIPVRLAAGAIGAIQLPRGAHYPSDVAAGAVIGWLSEKLASAALDAGERLWRRRSDRRQVAEALAEAEAHPS